MSPILGIILKTTNHLPSYCHLVAHLTAHSEFHCSLPKACHPKLFSIWLCWGTLLETFMLDNKEHTLKWASFPVLWFCPHCWSHNWDPLEENAFPGFPRQRWSTTVGRLACSGQWACREPGAHSPAGWCGVCTHSNCTGRCRLSMAGRPCEEGMRLSEAAHCTGSLRCMSMSEVGGRVNPGR